MIVVDLSETGGHLSAARGCSCDENKVLGQWDVIIIAESVFAENGICVVRISGYFVSFSDPILFSLKIFFEFEDDIEHISDIDIVDDDMRFDASIFFYDSHHLIDILLVVDIFVAQLPIG